MGTYKYKHFFQRVRVVPVSSARAGSMQPDDRGTSQDSMQVSLAIISSSWTQLAKSAQGLAADVTRCITAMLATGCCSMTCVATRK